MSTSRRTLFIRIEATDGTIYRMAPAFPYDIEMSNGNVYTGGVYTTASEIDESSDLTPSVIDIGSVYDTSIADRDEILSGKWDEAEVFIFMTDFDNPIEDDEEVKKFFLGKIREEDERFTVELMSLADKLNQKRGPVFTPHCQNIFCDQHIDGTIIASDRSTCGLNAATYTVTGTITSVTNKYTFADISRVEASGHFVNGEIRFTSGKNAGLSFRRISGFATSQFITQLPFYHLPEVGDNYTAIAGCSKDFNADCVTRYSNGVKFRGFPHIPTPSQVSKYGNQQ